MKLKRLLAILFILITILVLTGCKKDEEVKKEEPKQGQDRAAFEEKYGEYKPSMWLIEDEDTGSKIYLFGSIHVGLEGMYPLPDEVMKAFNESEILAVENDIIELEKDLTFSIELLSYLSYEDGTALIDNVSEEQLDQLREVADKYDFPILEDMSFKPIFYYLGITAMHIESTEYSESLGVDRHLLEIAKEKGMKIEEIEDASYTYELLGGLSGKTEQALLDELVKSYSSRQLADIALQLLYTCWVNGNLEMYIDEIEKDTDNEEFYEALLYVRNELMKDKIIEYLETGSKYFYVVGVLHFEGEKGIINLLEEEGYKVDRVNY